MRQGNDNYGAFKKAVAEELVSFLTGFQTEFQKVDDQKIQDRLQKSETHLRETANQTLLRAQKAVGLR